MVTFNIDNLGDIAGITITAVSVTIPIDAIVGHSELAGTLVNVKVFDYGNSLTLVDQGIGGVLVKTITTTDSLANLNFSSNSLKEQLQQAVNVDKQ